MYRTHAKTLPAQDQCQAWRSYFRCLLCNSYTLDMFCSNNKGLNFVVNMFFTYMYVFHGQKNFIPPKLSYRCELLQMDRMISISHVTPILWYYTDKVILRSVNVKLPAKTTFVRILFFVLCARVIQTVVSTPKGPVIWR
jgi:hypothetical protein